MPKLSLTDLEELRKKAKAAQAAVSSSKITILIGMGTCGVAAGARETWATFSEEIKNNGITNAEIKQTGCIGQCHSEPTVEVRVPGMPDIIYGNVDQSAAKVIVRQHLVEKSLVSGNIFDKPSPDIIAKK